MPVHFFCNDPTSCKKNVGSNKFQFCGYISQKIFQKSLNSDFRVWLRFLVQRLRFWKKWVRWSDAEFIAELIGTYFKPKKWKSKKLVCPFLIALFHFETNLIKYRSFLFSGPFWTVGKFCKDVQTKKLLRLSSSFLGYLPFIYGQNLDKKLCN